jgi:hypothetical protein
MARMGRPPKIQEYCTPELTEEICAILEDGNYVETACNVVGLSKKNFYQFMQRAREAEAACEGEDRLPTNEEVRYMNFRSRVTSAMAEAEARDLRTIRMAGARDWKALAWRLERRNPKRWGRRADVTSGGEPLKGGGIGLAELREFLAGED